MEYTSKGQGNLNTVLGAVGTAGTVFGNGLLSGLFGGGNGSASNNFVTKEVMEVQLQLIDAKKENAILAADLSSEKKMVEVTEALNTKINNVYDRISDRVLSLERTVAGNAAEQGVINSTFSTNLAVNTSQIAQLFGLTKLGIPNSSLCPGYGTATVTAGGSSTT